MAELFIYLFNILVVVSYGFCAFVSWRALKTLEEWHDFKFRDICNIVKQGWALFKKEKVPVNDTLGWYALYMGAATISASSALFALMHTEYLIDGDLVAVGIRDSALWFLIHMMNIIGSITVWFSVAKARMGAFSADRT